MQRDHVDRQRTNPTSSLETSHRHKLLPRIRHLLQRISHDTASEVATKLLRSHDDGGQQERRGWHIGGVHPRASTTPDATDRSGEDYGCDCGLRSFGVMGYEKRAGGAYCAEAVVMFCVADTRIRGIPRAGCNETDNGTNGI